MGARIKAGVYDVIHKWGKLSDTRLLTSGVLLQFRDSVNSYWEGDETPSQLSITKKNSVSLFRTAIQPDGV